jgi:hypothetical protein
MKEPFAAVAIFCATAAYELDKFIGAPNGLPAILTLVAIYLLPASIALWTVADAQERGRSMSYDFGSFIFFLWPLLAPIYIFQTRGVRAFGTIGLFALALLVLRSPCSWATQRLFNDEHI